MKAICLEAIEKLTIIEAEKPAITGPEQVLIEVKQVGVCGSEIHAFEGTHPYRKPPSILGHEMVGEVVAVGEGVTRFKAGDRITVDPQWPCGKCEWCRRGDHNLCPTKLVLGTKEWPGALGQYIIVPEGSVFMLPEHLTADQAAMIEPMGVAVHAAKRARLKAGEAALILGSGSIGHVTAAMCHVTGADPVIAVDIKPHCLDTVLQVGATHTIRADEEDVVVRVMDITEGKGVDVVFLTSHADGMFDIAMHAVRRQGRVVVIALFEHPVSIHPYDIIKKDMDIVGSIMSTDEDVNEALELIASGKVNIAPIVTHHLPIDEAQRGFELAMTKNDSAIKVMLQF